MRAGEAITWEGQAASATAWARKTRTAHEDAARIHRSLGNMERAVEHELAARTAFDPDASEVL